MKPLLLDYPSGAFGMALLLMRLSISALLSLASIGCGVAASECPIPAAVLACLIAGGFFTRLAASVFAVGGGVAIATGVLSPTYVPVAIEGLALALLGPGMWSIDAWTLRGGPSNPRDRRPHDR